MTLSLLFWLTLAAAGVGFWWQSDRVRSFAYQHVLNYSRERGLQLLDQSLVLVGLKPVRVDGGGLHLRRRYRFEFSTTGETRYKGWIEMNGVRVQKLDVEPHVLASSPTDETLH
jgi:hypothetical protein